MSEMKLQTATYSVSGKTGRFTITGNYVVNSTMELQHLRIDTMSDRFASTMNVQGGAKTFSVPADEDVLEVTAVLMDVYQEVLTEVASKKAAETPAVTASTVKK